MAWNTQCLEMVRSLIGDTDCTPEYSDDRLTRLLVVTAYSLVSEIDFDRTYTINVNTQSISPDPSLLDTPDNNFITLLVLKASHNLMLGESRKYGLGSVKIVDGPSTIDTSARVKSIKDFASELEMKFYKAKYLYQSGKNVRFVTGPSTNDNINPQQF